jgi:nicotinamide-nucleotide amidase
MAEGARRITGTDLAVSVTGVAGPDKDDRGNEVGTVFIGFSTPDGTTARQLDLGRGRERIRIMASHYALDIVRRYLAGQDQK